MKPIYDILTAIADRHLAIATLLERRGDRLDFHEVSVRGVKDALWYAYQAGVNARAQSGDEACVFREMREALERAEFLMRRVYEGDHHALENLASAAKQAHTALARMKARRSPSNGAAPDLPIVAVEVRGGVIDDVGATIPVHVVIEDGDVPDYDTGKKPTRWEDEPATAAIADKPYSVLLLYPDHVNDGGTETYYAFVEAPGPTEAVTQARRQVVAAQEGVEIDPDDFAPLLVTEGHHHSEPLFNK